jgi:hypothetical protein
MIDISGQSRVIAEKHAQLASGSIYQQGLSSTALSEPARCAPVAPLQMSSRPNEAMQGGAVRGARYKEDCLPDCIHTPEFIGPASRAPAVRRACENYSAGIDDAIFGQAIFCLPNSARQYEARKYSV